MPDLLVSHKRLFFPYDSAILETENVHDLWWLLLISCHSLMTLTTECLNLWYFLVSCFDMTSSRKEIQVKSWARS